MTNLIRLGFQLIWLENAVVLLVCYDDEQPGVSGHQQTSGLTHQFLLDGYLDRLLIELTKFPQGLDAIFFLPNFI
jgi:hypothetical protein